MLAQLCGDGVSTTRGDKVAAGDAHLTRVSCVSGSRDANGSRFRSMRTVPNGPASGMITEAGGLRLGDRGLRAEE